ncbi:glycosyl hydrolase [Brevibacillus sp. SAFN-007a]|uniref:glycosyl hydrolase n=1 Tax=Brevibacillus sp. SAFN-007a TaxID=3436862 RepID=UPI003F7FC693
MPRYLFSKKAMLVAGLSVLTVFGCFYFFLREKRVPSPTETFIVEQMTNPNGTLATYLQDAPAAHADIVSGREALSESLGLWMQYALAGEDQKLFDKSYQVLKTYFLSPQAYVYWKLSADGRSHVTTNALGDDLRIVDALWQAADTWGQTEYRQTATAVTETLLASSIQDGYLVDFHDFGKKESPHTLSLAYVDMSALKRMAAHGMIDAPMYNRYRDLLLNLPDDGLFYPKIFHIEKQLYKYDDSINLIDQLIVALHRAEIGGKSEALIAFLKKEFAERKQLPGRYDRLSRTAAVSYESPAVYGLAILLALKLDDPEWARQLQERMLKLRSVEARYFGGYVFDDNTHVFDNLFPLLAEEAMRRYVDRGEPESQ